MLLGALLQTLEPPPQPMDMELGSTTVSPPPLTPTDEICFSCSTGKNGPPASRLPNRFESVLPNP